jgi:hypothetical protein
MGSIPNNIQGGDDVILYLRKAPVMAPIVININSTPFIFSLTCPPLVFSTLKVGIISNLRIGAV